MALDRIGKILVIDDDASLHGDFMSVLGASAGESAANSLSELEARMFGSANMPVRQSFDLAFASQGQEGVELARAAHQAGSPFMLAFVDMRMPPGWDGLRTIQELWAADPHVQVVICTAHGDYSWESALHKLDGSERLLVIKKPFDPVEVWQAARMFCAKWKLSRDAESRFANLERTLAECAGLLSSAGLSQPGRARQDRA
ncbi:response regulator [Caenimonas sp. SL110]|uniref:response regulator n=1 Tax=Caenimonas sp. SL110 TaxID=1450524 RepID=UPI00069FD027|nr:response regulator [Caenimonas sp. SL110]